MLSYDQSQRNTYWTQLQQAGYDPSKITVACEEDCTAGVSANVKAAGHLMAIKALQNVPICSSRNMRSEFAKAGFIVLSASKYLVSPDCLLPGDILLYEGHHASTNITVGAAVKAQWSPGNAPEADTEAFPCVVATGDVHIRRGPDKGYDSMGVLKRGGRLRYFGYTDPNGWLLVEHDRATGWVSGKYARAESE